MKSVIHPAPDLAEARTVEQHVRGDPGSGFHSSQEMNDPVDLLFGGMEKLGPGSNADTRHVLSLLPARQFGVVVDAGCGSGRQTLVLARELGTQICAVDSSQLFLNDLVRRAGAANLGHLVQARRMNMKDIPQAFDYIDLLWSEGAAYNIGFSQALATWAPAITPGGFAVVSEISWLDAQAAPPAVKEFFRTGYPDIHTVDENIRAAEGSGYKLIATHTLPRRTWIDGYYEILRPKASALLKHSDPSVRDFAAETLREIEVFECSEDSYGYVFYVLQRVRRFSGGLIWL